MTDISRAQPSQPATPSVEDLEDNIDSMFLTFALADEAYGVGIGMVTEIVGMQKIMPVPDVPTYVRGVINLRGQVIPLMDMRLRFGMEERAYDERTVVIVLDLSDGPLGLIVDGVREVLDIPADNIDPPSRLGRSTGRSVVCGLGRVADHVVILIDVHALLGDEKIEMPASDVAA